MAAPRTARSSAEACAEPGAHTRALPGVRQKHLLLLTPDSQPERNRIRVGGGLPGGCVTCLILLITRICPLKFCLKMKPKQQTAGPMGHIPEPSIPALSDLGGALRSRPHSLGKAALPHSDSLHEDFGQELVFGFSIKNNILVFGFFF